MAVRDYEEFIELLNGNGVRYMIADPHAVAFHARPRATKDLDIFHDPSPDAAERILSSIRHFFAGADIDLTVADLIDPDTIIQLGVAPVRIDLLSSLAGIPSFETAWANRVDAFYGDVRAHYLSLDDLIRAKTASGRDQDRADLRSLARARSRKSRM